MREMKDSGVKWIGNIPEVWDQKHLKYLCSITTGNEDTQNADPEGTFPFYVRSPEVERCNRYTFDGEGILVAGDGAGAGRVFHHAFGKYAIHQRVYLFYDFKINTSFLHYYISNLFPQLMNYGSAQSTVPSLRLPMLQNFNVVIPSLKEQQLITRFLYSKCAEIDSISEDIRKEIETLQEYRKSIITEAVTKGLDPNVEMKDSGVEWIGMIPNSWELEKGKYVFIQKNERGNTICLQLLSPTQKYGVIPQDKYEELSGMKAVKLNEKVDLSELKTVHKGAFCISLRSFQGGFEYSDYEGVVSPAYQIFYPTRNICDDYYRYLFKTQGFIQEMNSFTMSLRDGKNIAFEDFGNSLIPVPPLSIQNDIATFLNTKCSEIDSIIADKQKQLDVLAEYRKSLIYEYVTGKKEVPTK